MIVRSVRGRTGAAMLRVEADGLNSASVVLRSSAAVKSVPRDK